MKGRFFKCIPVSYLFVKRSFKRKDVFFSPFLSLPHGGWGGQTAQNRHGQDRPTDQGVHSLFLEQATGLTLATLPTHSWSGLREGNPESWCHVTSQLSCRRCNLFTNQTLAQSTLCAPHHPWFWGQHNLKGLTWELKCLSEGKSRLHRLPLVCL